MYSPKLHNAPLILPVLLHCGIMTFLLYFVKHYNLSIVLYIITNKRLDSLLGLESNLKRVAMADLVEG